MILALTASGLVLATTSPAPAQTETGRILTRKYDFKEAGKEMQYTLYLPKKYDPKNDKQAKFPLIVALHGLRSNPQQIIRYPGLTKQAEQHGYIVVAPMGYNSRGWYGSRGKGGGHVRVAFEHFPEIFEFFNANPKSETNKPRKSK